MLCFRVYVYPAWPLEAEWMARTDDANGWAAGARFRLPRFSLGIGTCRLKEISGYDNGREILNSPGRVNGMG